MTRTADAQGSDQFKRHRSGGWGLDELLDWFTQHPHADAQGGEAGLLAQEIIRLRQNIADARTLATAQIYVRGADILALLGD